MITIRGGLGQGVVLRDANFTGLAWGDPILSPGDGGLAMSTVYLSPCSRTHWHSHESGQLLAITSGEGLVAEREGSVARVRAGDFVWTEPGVEHFHGALDESMLVHTTLSLGGTEWLGPVSDDEYRAAFAAA